MSTAGLSAAADFLDRLRAAIGAAGLTRLAENARQLASWTHAGQTHVVVCGEFNRGKSSLVNALLDVEVCRVDSLPETALPAVIEHGQSTTFALHLRDGSTRPIQAAELERYSASSANARGDIEHLAVTCPSEILAGGVTLIDTPGVNDLSTQSADVAYGYLPFADVALMLLDSTAPVTRTEAKFLTDHVLRHVSDRIIFILAKADRLDSHDLEESLDGARERLREILSRDPVLLPFSTRRPLRDVHVEALRTELAKWAETAKADRAAVAARRARELACEALAECEARIAIADLDPTERTTALVRLEGEKTALMRSVSRCHQFTDLYGRQTLQALIAKSLYSLKDQVQADLLHHVDVSTGGLDEFVTKEAPHRIATALRQWSQAKAGEIHAFLSGLTARVSTDCSRTFGRPMRIEHGVRRVEMPGFAVRTPATDSDRMNAMIMDHLLPTALPMLAGYVLLGPLGILAGSFVGRMAEHRIAEHQLSRQREEARRAIPQQMDLAFGGFEQALRAAIDRWFGELDDLVRREADARAAGAEDRWTQADRAARTRLEDAAAQLRALAGGSVA